MPPQARSASERPGTRLLEVEVSEEVHAGLRTWAAEFGLPLPDFVRCLIEEALRERFPQTGPRRPQDR